MHGIVTTWTQCVLKVLVSDQWALLTSSPFVSRSTQPTSSFLLESADICNCHRHLFSSILLFFFFKSNIRTCRCLWSLPRFCVRMYACVLCYHVCDVDCWRKSVWTYPGMMVYRCRRKCETTRRSSHTFGLAHFFFFSCEALFDVISFFLIYFKQADVLTLFFFNYAAQSGR